ncbi:MAG: molybdopterin molybdenumtransferase MoeA [Chloroflexi bacterium]|nr:molybdopterin molybdenumtransferase MoeA [Chloroflexota bacterium]
MPEFLTLLSPDEARSLLFRHLPDLQPAAEKLETRLALERVTAAPVRSPHPLPEFPRSTVDGYAVHAGDTFGASDSLPAYLKVIGEVPMGDEAQFTLAPGEAAIIHTGGMLPEGANAVVMLENTQNVQRVERKERGDDSNSPGACVRDRCALEIEVLRAVADGENILRAGEDVTAGQIVIPAGARIRPAEIGGLMALGITQLRVATKPKVGIISSGDEIVPPESDPRPGQVRDINSYTLAALVTRAGGEPVLYGIVPDKLAALKTLAARALAECDLVVITAGSSASARDMTAEAIRSLGSPGVLVHGVNIRPGKPTILAVCDGKALIGLPGNPVSALVVAALFVVPLVERLLGLPLDRPRPSLMAKLTINIPSQAGREDWVAVKLHPSPAIGRGDGGEGEWLAEPIFGKSNLIFSLAAADGLLRIPPDATGLAAGEVVEVMLM